MRRIAILLCIVFMLMISTELFADTIYLKNGTQFKGRLIRQDDEKVTFGVGEKDDIVEATFYNDEILRIDKEELTSFITLPFDGNKTMNIPRPLFDRVPAVTEAKEEQKKLYQPKETGQVEKNISGQLDNKMNALSEIASEDSTKRLLEAVSKESGENTPQGSSVASSSSSPIQLDRVTQELTELLNEEEKTYFTSVTSLMEGLMGKMMIAMSSGPGALNQRGQEALPSALTQEMSPEIDKAIANLESLRPPELFANLHKLFLKNFELMKGMFTGEDGTGNVSSKAQEIQNSNAQLQDELRNILEIKKKQVSS